MLLRRHSEKDDFSSLIPRCGFGFSLDTDAQRRMDRMDIDSRSSRKYEAPELDSASPVGKQPRLRGAFRAVAQIIKTEDEALDEFRCFVVTPKSPISSVLLALDATWFVSRLCADLKSEFDLMA